MNLHDVAARIEPGMRVGVDGVMGAGKTVFADALATLVPATRLSIDRFHRPAELRVDYYTDAFDLTAFRAAVEAVDGTVIADGIFIHKPEIRDVWDLSVWLDVDRAAARGRALTRDSAWMEDAVARYEGRYGPAEDRYLEEVDPASLADIVVDAFTFFGD
jgi:uridine kinase